MIAMTRLMASRANERMVPSTRFHLVDDLQVIRACRFRVGCRLGFGLDHWRWVPGGREGSGSGRELGMTPAGTPKRPDLEP